MFLGLSPTTFQECFKSGPIGSMSLTDFGWIGRLKAICPLRSVVLRRLYYVISVSPFRFDRCRVIYISCQGKLIRTEKFYRMIENVE